MDLIKKTKIKKKVREIFNSGPNINNITDLISNIVDKEVERCSKDKLPHDRERYFIVFYSAFNNNESCSGTDGIKTFGYINLKEVKDFIAETTGFTNIGITNIIEIDEIDFQSFK